MSDHEHDKQRDRDEREPAEPTRHEPPEDLTDNSGHQPQDNVTLGGIDPGLTTNEFGDISPHDVEPDDEQTRADLDESDVDLLNPAEQASSMVITIEDHKIKTDAENAPSAESVTSVQEMGDEDLQRLRRIMDEEAARRGVRQERPFKDLDLDSLQVLYNQVRAELGQR